MHPEPIFATSPQPTLKMPQVSIIMPTFRHEGYIAEAIRSVQTQTMEDWELIIVDDDSPDRTLAIAQELAATDPRIACLTQANKGIFALHQTYNRALAQAKGKYIAILEGDDAWTPEKLEWQVSALKARPETVLAWGRARCGPRPLDSAAPALPPADRDTRTFANDPPGTILNTLYLGNHIPALTLLIRRDALDAVGGFRQSHGLPLVDLPTLLPLAERGPFHYDPRVLGGWRIYAGQVTKTHTVAMLRGLFALSLDHFDALPAAVAANVGVDRRSIVRAAQDAELIGYARSGRYRLIRKEFAAARRDQLSAIFYPTTRLWVWRTRAMVGLIAGFFCFDVERLARVLGKKSYSAS
jgi:glycosyltransferase involved in cell wall biosynthesis